jgi:putative aldouronate transport system substrate-binding protein
MYQLSRRRVLAATSATLAVILTLGLAACSDDEKAPDDLANYRVGSMSDYGVGVQFKATQALELPLLYNVHPNYPNKADWLFWSELQKRTNVTFKLTEVPLSDYNAKRTTLVQSGQAPWIMPKTYPGQETPYVALGALLPVSDYIDLMPNFKKKLTDWNLAPDINTLKQQDGKYYLLPGLHEDVTPDYTFAVRTDILAKLNISTPKTLDEFYNMLKKMKEAYPDSYPLSDRFNNSPKTQPGGNLIRTIAAAYGARGGWDYQNAMWDYDQNKFVLTGSSDKFKAALQYLNKLIAEGLLDPESFTQTDDQARQKLASGKSFVISSNQQNIVNDYAKDLAMIPGATMAKIPTPQGPAGAVKFGTRLENGVAISKEARNSPNFVATMQFIDWLWYSPEGEEFAKWGVSGTTFNKDGSGKWTLTKDVDVLGLNPGAPKHLQKDFGFYNGVFAYGGTKELVRSFFSPAEQAFQQAMADRKTLAVPPPYPFSDEEREQATTIETGLTDYVTQQELKFILGQRSFGEWDAYVGELKAKNSDTYMNLVQTAYTRFKAITG